MNTIQKAKKMIGYEIKNCEMNIKTYEEMIKKGFQEEFFRNEINLMKEKIKILEETKLALDYY